MNIEEFPDVTTKTYVTVRWMIRRDMDEVLKIERDGFSAPWGEEEFLKQLRQRSTIGMVAEFDTSVVGYMVYEMHKQRYQLLNIAVAKGCRRIGVGQVMIEKLKNKLDPQRRRRIVTEVSESNLNAQLFFRGLGFRAIEVMRDYFQHPDGRYEDAYVMRYQGPRIDG